MAAALWNECDPLSDRIERKSRPRPEAPITHVYDLHSRLFACLLLVSVGCLSRAGAQDALPAPLGIDASATRDASLSADTNDYAPLPQREAPPTAATGLAAIFARPGSTGLGSQIQVVAKADVRMTYDDNLFINQRNKQSDLIFTFSPTIALGIGDLRSEFRRLGLSTFSPAVIDEAYDPRSFIFVRYTPTVNIFLDHAGENALDHDAAVQAQWRQTYLTLGFETRFQTLSDPDLDVGDRVRRTIFSQDFTAIYDYSDRTSFEFGLEGAVRHYPTQVDSQEIFMQNSVNYHLGARTAVGLGFTLGWLHVEDSGDQPFEQLLVRGRYHLSEKIDIYGNAGIEFRQFEQRDDHVEPVFQFGVTYQPWEQTTLALGVVRRLDNSAGSPGFDVISTTVALDAQQRFGGHYYVGFLARYESAQYLSVSRNSGERQDNILLLQPYVKMDISKSAAIELGYTFRHDDSNLDRFTFSQNRVFVQFDALF